MADSFKNFLNHFHRKVYTDPSKSVLYPDRDWRRLFLFFWACLALISLWSVYSYFLFRIQSLPDSMGLPEGVKVLSGDTFKPVFDFFDARAVEFEEVLSRAPALSDPGRK